MTVTVKDIYKRVCNLECSGYNSYGSKFGGYTNPLMEQVQANVEREVEEYLPEGTLARKIYEDRRGKSFSSKQLWVIAYELIKNEAYVAMIERERLEEEAELHGCTVEEWVADEE